MVILLKFEIVKCKKRFNESFEEETLYKAYPNKKGHHQVFVGTERHLIRPRRVLVRSERDFYLNYFEPIGCIMLRSVKECKELQNKTINEILEMMKK